jgi:hypothetical protein
VLRDEERHGQPEREDRCEQTSDGDERVERSGLLERLRQSKRNSGHEEHNRRKSQYVHACLALRYIDKAEDSRTQS